MSARSRLIIAWASVFLTVGYLLIWVAAPEEAEPVGAVLAAILIAVVLVWQVLERSRDPHA